MKKRYLVLCDGTVFAGYAFGAELDGKKQCVGEAVFTTCCGGYVETLTDPSYYGQIIVQTFPMIGNYGFINEDAESPYCRAVGYVVREKTDAPSNFRCNKTVEEFLIRMNVPGIYGVDTREITKHITRNGVMNAVLTDDPENADLEDAKVYRITDSLRKVSCDKTETVRPAGETKYRVAMIDYGEKRNIVRSLVNIGCEVTLFPFDTTAERISAAEPDGVLLSNGPGDPADCVEQIEQIKKLLGKYPLMAICLGHQLAAIAAGGTTEKLRFGHRGVNHPVRDNVTGKMYITSQNHGYAVVSDSMNATAGKIRFVNNNDMTCEGIDYDELDAFSVQFHPEACAGPLDASFLFCHFTDMMERRKQTNADR
ncbi:MAG TPA: carbamoyl phosphate synthase small subunit [Bacillota bacterium]|nr:carbamoyl phosphate synthase small subunit [Bacillota bacterium]